MSPRRLSGAALAMLGLLLAACGDGGTESSNPIPAIVTLEPNSVQQRSGETALRVIGNDFVRQSVVRVKGTDRPTQFVSGTELRATLTAADVEAAGQIQVLVFNPEPGGGVSNAAPLTVSPVQNPLPVVSALAPAALTAGGASTDVTVTGTGFVAGSRAYVGNAVRPTTFVSATQLRVQVSDTILATSGARTLSVVNPQPGGGVSSPFPFEVRAPQPAISSLGTTQTTAGREPLTLTVNGTGFLANSIVQVNGTAVPTTFVNGGVLNATLSEGMLRAAGTLTITVVNAAPGGGVSGPLPLQVVNGAPVITILPSRGATAGRGGFTLYVHGTSFVENSVVRWNGQSRPTQYLGGTRLAATIAAEDVAGARTAEITVSNPAPGGGTSSGVSFTVRTLGSAAAVRRTVAISARDLVYDPGSDRVYASARSTSAYANSIVAIDPSAGTVAGSVFVGSEPGRVARSDDGQFLYVGLDGASAIRRVDLPSLTPGIQWSLTGGQVAGDLEVLPGRPRSVAVSRHNRGYSPPLDGVTIYDDGVARPQSSPGHTGGNRIEFLESSSVLYGFNNAHTGFEFFTMGVDAAGVRHTNETRGVIGGFYTDILGESGRIYGTDGSVVDAARRVRMGTLGGGEAMAVDAGLGRAFVLSGSAIIVYDLNTFQSLATVTVAGVSSDHPALAVSRMVRWGDNGLAFVDTNQIYLISSPVFGR
ncbi:IPT/TIG domain-containing protein [Longimicrobium terrae]|uniref:Cyclic nucleotide-binding domain-containing protein n=1 Tax=Longimicrobium terrae TaxID=1639882 RepID=A0A841GTY8_9BACT|nr:IPT/TIG domain-containing protein [Longimicrobium terrae]MBB4634412.1 hypothetical protein [Longimicrobium terrae]MBB6068698.1 hypothetical protein [Longimicrobium terrae]NNC27884.1 hypothetical protein [Longimicrobium terrae]